MTTRAAIVLSLLAAAAAVAPPATAQPADATRLKDRITGDAKAPASANTRCRLFTPAEIQGFLGTKVGAGQNGAGGMGCNWSDANGGIVIVTIAEGFQTPRPSASPGFKTLPSLGPKAWVAPSMGWSAGTEEGKTSVYINMSGTTASEAGAVALLKETIQRGLR